MKNRARGIENGGISGAAITLLAAGPLLASIGIVGIPFCLIAGAASTFGGKAITNLIFGKEKHNKKINELKQGLRDAVADIMDKLSKSSTLEQWLKNTCEDAYNMLASDIDKEWENSLKTMEDALTQIKVDIEMNENNKKKCEEDIDEYSKEIKSILENIKPVQDKLSIALNS